MAKSRYSKKGAFSLQNLNNWHFLWLLVPVLILGISKVLNDIKKGEVEKKKFNDDSELYAALIAQALGTYTDLVGTLWNWDAMTEDEDEVLRIIKEQARSYSSIAVAYQRLYKRRLSEDIVRYLDSSHVEQIKHII